MNTSRAAYHTYTRLKLVTGYFGLLFTLIAWDATLWFVGAVIPFWCFFAMTLFVASWSVPRRRG